MGTVGEGQGHGVTRGRFRMKLPGPTRDCFPIVRCFPKHRRRSSPMARPSGESLSPPLGHVHGSELQLLGGPVLADHARSVPQGCCCSAPCAHVCGVSLVPREPCMPRAPPRDRLVARTGWGVARTGWLCRRPRGGHGCGPPWPCRDEPVLSDAHRPGRGPGRHASRPCRSSPAFLWKRELCLIRSVNGYVAVK